MATAVLDVAIGRNALIYITPQIKNGPVFSAASIGTLSFTGRFQDADYEITLATENLSPVGAFNQNPVPYEQQGRFQLTEFTMALPLVANGSTNLNYGNVLRVCSEISFYHLLEVQLWDNETVPVEVDDFQMMVVMTTPIHRTGSKPRIMDSAVFELIPTYNSGTGLWIANPNFGSF